MLLRLGLRILDAGCERAGRAGERLDQPEISDAIHRQMLDAAAHRPHSGDDLLDRLHGGES